MYMRLHQRHLLLAAGFLLLAVGALLPLLPAQQARQHEAISPTPEPTAGIAAAAADRGEEAARAEKSEAYLDNELSGTASMMALISTTAMLLGLGLVLAYIIVERRYPQVPQADYMEIYKMLSSGTRQDILNELVKGERTPTYLSARIRKSKATVVEHLNRLIDAQLVEKREEEGKKFVFYKLTSKGKAVLRGRS